MKRTFSVFVVLLMLFMLPGISLSYNKMGPYISGQLGVSSLTDSDVSTACCPNKFCKDYKERL